MTISIAALVLEVKTFDRRSKIIGLQTEFQPFMAQRPLATVFSIPWTLDWKKKKGQVDLI